MRFFYPTSVLVTGYEILHLWVARMQMAGLWFEGRAPFAHCIINGIVRDKRGKKMSKSLGNVVDPLVMMDKYGTDAFRFSLVSQAHPGRDIPFSEDSLRGPRNFANKVWNSTRFVLMNLPADPPAGGWRLSGLDRSRLELCDRWILSEFQGMASRVRRLMDEYELAAASDEVYAFLWDKFCDWYVELSKPRLGSGDPESLGALRAVLVQVLSGTLKLLHPVMPFLTEELYQALKAHSGETAGLLLENGPPALGGDWSDPGAQETMAFVMGAVRSVRALRSQLNVPPALQISVRFESKDPAGRKLLLENAGYFKHLARVGDLAEGSGRPPRSATAACAGLAFHVPLAGVIDFERERERIDREVARLSEESGRLGGRLSDAEFLSRAPQTEVDKLRRRSLEVRAELDSLLATLDGLKVDG
jgi:valyl-tRNA synthetase